MLTSSEQVGVTPSILPCVIDVSQSNLKGTAAQRYLYRQTLKILKNRKIVDAMPQKKCFEFVVKNKVQGVGLRLSIAKQIPDELEVRTDNLPDGSVRVTVRGQEQGVKRFWEELQKQTLGKAENPTFSQPQEIVEIPINTDRFFHKLQCEQMGKFVDVGLDMKTSIDDMSGKIAVMTSTITELPQNIRNALKR